MHYDAFVSYAHKSMPEVAQATQIALMRIAKTWGRPRALRIFLDRSNLADTADRRLECARAIMASGHFVYVATPEAAASVQIGQEIELWRSRAGAPAPLVVLVDGSLRWSGEMGDFDPVESSAIHPAMRGMFAVQPFCVDLRGMRDASQLSLRNPAFLRAMASLVAAIDQSPLERLLVEGSAQHLRTSRVALLAACAIPTLLVASLVVSLSAWNAASEARTRLDLIQTVLPSFATSADQADDSATQTLGSALKLFGVGKPDEREVLFGRQFVAMRADCVGGEGPLSDQTCPMTLASFDADGLRTDIPGLSTLSKALVAHLLETARGAPTCDTTDAIANEAGEGREGEAKPWTAAKGRAISTLLDNASGLIPDAQWESLRAVPGWQPRAWQEHYQSAFSIWQGQLQNRTGPADLVLMRLENAGYCGSGGCNSSLLGFMRVAGETRVVLSAQANEVVMISNPDMAKMPQFLVVNASQTGVSRQTRWFWRFGFSADLKCYRPYLSGKVNSEDPHDDQRVPFDVRVSPLQTLKASLPTERN